MHGGQVPRLDAPLARRSGFPGDGVANHFLGDQVARGVPRDSIAGGVPAEVLTRGGPSHGVPGGAVQSVAATDPAGDGIVTAALDRGAGGENGPRRLGREVIARGVIVGVLLTLAVAVPVILGQRGGQAAPVDLAGRSQALDAAALRSTTTSVPLQTVPRAIAPLQTASMAALPTATVATPVGATATSAPATTETSETVGTEPAAEEEPTTASQPQVATVAPATVAPAPPSTATAAPPVPTTAPPAPPADRTLSFPGGRVTVATAPGSVRVVSTEPGPRYQVDVVQLSPDAVSVNFLGLAGWDQIVIRVGADGEPVAVDNFSPTVTNPAY